MNLLIVELGLTVESIFVPFSQSRNRAEKHKSLNWRCTIKRNGHAVLTVEHSAGIGYCPAYKNFPKDINLRWVRDAIDAECETGKVAIKFPSDPYFRCIGGPILPDSGDVLASLFIDAGSVMQSNGFAGWCADCGYSDDSMKARAAFDQCMQIALALRAVCGPDKFDVLAAWASER